MLYLRFSLKWQNRNRSYEALSSVVAALQDSVHENGRRGAGVQRLGAPAQRQRDERITGLRHPGAQPSRLRAQDEHDAATVVGFVVARRGGGIGAVAPAAALLRLAEEVGQVAHARDPQVLDGPR